MKDIDKKNMVEQLRPLLALRTQVYDLLRRTFIMEPSPDYVKYLEKFDLADFPFANESDEIRKGLESVQKYLTNASWHNPGCNSGFNPGWNSPDWNNRGFCEDLVCDYTHLFIGPHSLPAPPWESAYMNEERLLFQEETLQVRRAYLKYQFLPLRYKQEADDHLGLELDFMFRLSVLTLMNLNSQEKQAVPLYDILTDQKQFLEHHLLRWVPALCQDIIKSANTEFYQGMAYILSGFLKLDLEALTELLGIETQIASNFK